jgi:hypothetical protein
MNSGALGESDLSAQPGDRVNSALVMVGPKDFRVFKVRVVLTSDSETEKRLDILRLRGAFSGLKVRR